MLMVQAKGERFFTTYETRFSNSQTVFQKHNIV